MQELSFFERLQVLYYIFSLWSKRKFYELERRLPVFPFLHFPVFVFPNAGLVIDVNVPIAVVVLAIIILSAI